MIEIRPLTTHPEFQDAVHLQQEIWGFEEIELLPLRLFVVATKVGGQAFGAFDGKCMIGFCLAIPGLKSGAKSYLHSHMLGVLPEYRDAHIGRRLKLAQRDDALDRGIDLVEWTFDPLEIKNAFFNMERLGAIVRRYVLNQYGTTTSHLHGGLPTDRCIAEWWIASPRATAIVAGQPFDRNPVEQRISIPSDIAEIRSNDPTRAREIQHRASEEFREGFDRGLAVIGFEKSPDAGTYLLGKWESS
ncbi:MAG TPA: GNAT family N-acetyltransferase [Bryobacteraceae bacterium]|nr:GNAT family N-acetyltransferase [Bryobacteraceae bacterium]